MYSWYLDAVSANWGAAMSDDLNTLFPISFTVKLGVKQFHQAMFTRQFDLLGQGFSIHKVLSLLENQFKFVQFRSHLDISAIENKETRVYQSMNLKDEYQNKYATNAKRLIKKSIKNYSFKKVNCIDELIDLVNENVAHKIKEFTTENIIKLKNLMIAACDNDKGETLAVFEGNEIVGAGFFLKDKSRVTYLKGASTDLAKKNGAMYGLMNFAFDSYKNDYEMFDFGGSNVEGVATFYKKFGALDNAYYNYIINDLPVWFNFLKKLKRQ
tara:strand:+ start:1441 stop:2247 length:807 start_codon:yes stop_codon:yes gene_type:complete